MPFLFLIKGRPVVKEKNTGKLDNAMSVDHLPAILSFFFHLINKSFPVPAFINERKERD